MDTNEKPIELYIRLYSHLLKDLAAAHSWDPLTAQKDIDTLKRRVRGEGLEFLTKTLPSLGKALDKAISKDVAFECPAAFKRAKGRVTPVFLGVYFEQIFDSEGHVLEYSSPDNPWPLYAPGEQPEVLDWENPSRERAFRWAAKAVRAVRQVCYLMYKLRGGESAASVEQAYATFFEVDASLPDEDEVVPLPEDIVQVLENTKAILHYVLANFSLEHITPRHGAGAVATGEKPWTKMSFKRFYSKVDEVYPYADNFFFNYSHLCDDLQVLEGMVELAHSCAKLTHVPKDSRGPRLISMEPLEIQWVQQGQRALMYDYIQTHKATAGYVNFDDQEVNRRLALSNSFFGDQATLDMKEASDRVSLWLVKKLFPPHVFRYIVATRSSYTELKGRCCVPLKKFAPMGSALCFPVEALLFWALAVGTLKTCTKASHFKRLPEVYVYGDDIILSKEVVPQVVRVYEACFLQVNVDKSCTGRFFRESCGMDAFMLQDVTPLKCKAPWPPSCPADSLSWIEYSNSLWDKGYQSASDFVKGQLIQILGAIPVVRARGVLPYAFVRPDGSYPVLRENLLSQFKSRYNTCLQRDEVYLPGVRTPSLVRGLPEWSELLRLGLRESHQDPFGFDREQPLPCHYDVPHHLKMRGAWVALELVLASV